MMFVHEIHDVCAHSFRVEQCIMYVKFISTFYDHYVRSTLNARNIQRRAALALSSEVALVSRIDKIIGLFCKRAL